VTTYVDDLGKGSGTRRHEDLSNTVVEVLDTLVRHSKIGLGRPLLSLTVDQLPYSVLDRVLLAILGSASRQDPDFETAHGEQELGVLGTVDRGKGVFPLDCRQRSRQAVLDIPEHCSTEIDIVLVQTHSTILGPTSPVGVVDNIFVVWIRVHGEVSLNQISRLVRSEAEENMNSVNISSVESDWVSLLGSLITVLQETVPSLGWTGHLARSL
jgi:hypothetical protein